MHMVIGLLLLGAMSLLGRAWGDVPLAMKLFLPLWLVASAVNMRVGVRRPGYTVAEELPILLVIFGVPALIALGLIRFLRA